VAYVAHKLFVLKAMIGPSRSLPLCAPSGPWQSGRCVVEGAEITLTPEVSLAAKIHNGFSQATSTPVTDALPKTISDLSLLLVFDEIVHQACSISAAISAAVVRIQEGIPISRAVCDQSFSVVSAYLTQCSATSWKAGLPQLCQDAEIDSRFDRGGFRRLGVRSFVVMPVRNKEKAVVAIMEAFSCRPQAFSHGDLLGLKGLARRIEKHIAVAEQTLASQTVAFRPKEPAIAPQRITNSRGSRFSSIKTRLPGDVWNVLLAGLTIVVAILLGWALGRTEKQHTRQTLPLHSVVAVQQAEAVSESHISGPDPLANRFVTSPPLTSASEVDPEHERSQANSAIHKTHLTSSAARSKHTEASVDDVVIFENGKQVFPKESAQSEPPSDQPDSKKNSPESANGEPAVRLPEQVAEERVVTRIEPDYSEHARERRLQGTVILNVLVDKLGSVSSLSRVSGDTQLTLLAAKAVRQWKFAPLVRDGAPVSFESRITLDFALP
jgi:TonB family protein